MKQKIAILLSVVLLHGCGHNPVTGEKEMQLVSEQQEIAIGDQYYPLMQQAEGGLYVAEPSVQKYVEGVGMKLAKVSDRPDLPYEFVVLNNSIPNAWALPGGKIAINRGLLLELSSEAELAAVLAHEIVHSAARHGAKNIERTLLISAGMIGLGELVDGRQYEEVAIAAAATGSTLVMLKYSREAELEADKYGIAYMVRAGYDPEAAVELQKMFLRLAEEKGNQVWFGGLFSTHPPTEERIAQAEALVAQYPKGGYIGKEAYEKGIAPLEKHKEAYTDLDDGYMALSRGDLTQASSLAAAGIKIEPREAHLYNLQGKIALKRGDLPSALASFNKAIQLNPNYFDFYLQRGLLEYRQNNRRASLLDLQHANSLLPTVQGTMIAE